MTDTITVDRAKLVDILKGAVNENLANALLDEITVRNDDVEIDFAHDEVRVYLGSGDWGAVYVNGVLFMERHHDDIQGCLVELLEKNFDVLVDYNDDYRAVGSTSPREIAHKRLSDFSS